MIGVLITKLQLFYRNLWIFLLLVIGSIGFAFIIGSGDLGKIKIPLFIEGDTVNSSLMMEQLETSDLYTFQLMDETDAKESLRGGKAELIVELKEETYNVYVNVESQHVKMIDQLLHSVYLNEMRDSYLINNTNIEGNFINNYDLFTVETTNVDGNEQESFNMMYQPLFGFTLFFVIYTIAYNVFYILIERVDGIWDRMILSPIKKWEIYMANLLYSFFVGYIQIVIVFSIFYYVFDFNFNNRFIEVLLLAIPYVFTIVSLMILVTSIVKTTQQFNAIIPLVAVGMAMIGGAYWPLEVVENKVMLFLAKLMPVTYGMDILNGLTLYNKSIDELLFPVSILLFLGVLFAGVGIHIMERRHI